jgi:hypothetical protein
LEPRTLAAAPWAQLPLSTPPLYAVPMPVQMEGPVQLQGQSRSPSSRASPWIGRHSERGASKQRRTRGRRGQTVRAWQAGVRATAFVPPWSAGVARAAGAPVPQTPRPRRHRCPRPARTTAQGARLTPAAAAAFAVAAAAHRPPPPLLCHSHCCCCCCRCWPPALSASARAGASEAQAPFFLAGILLKLSRHTHMEGAPWVLQRLHAAARQEAPPAHALLQLAAVYDAERALSADAELGKRQAHPAQHDAAADACGGQAWRWRCGRQRAGARTWTRCTHSARRPPAMLVHPRCWTVCGRRSRASGNARARP